MWLNAPNIDWSEKEEREREHVIVLQHLSVPAAC